MKRDSSSLTQGTKKSMKLKIRTYFKTRKELTTGQATLRALLIVLSPAIAAWIAAHVIGMAALAILAYLGMILLYILTLGQYKIRSPKKIYNYFIEN